MEVVPLTLEPLAPPSLPLPGAPPIEIAVQKQETVEETSPLGAIMGAIFGVLLLLCCLAVLFFLFCRKRQCKAELENGNRCPAREDKEGLCADHCAELEQHALSCSGC